MRIETSWNSECQRCLHQFGRVVTRLGVANVKWRIENYLNCKFSIFIFQFSILLAALLLTSCDRRDLEVMDPQKVQIRIEVDWLNSYGVRPNGMTVMIWGDGWERPFTSSSNNVESMTVELDPGHYRLLVMNKSFSEYGSMKFTNTDSFEDITARGVNITQYQNGEWDKGVTYMADPEEIGCAVDEFDITEQMLIDQVNFYPYDDWIDQQYANTRFVLDSDGTYSIQEEVKPQVTKLNVWVQIKGKENMRSIVGSISGMAIAQLT